MKKYLFLLLTLFIATTSCRDEHEIADSGNVKNFTFNIQVDKQVETRSGSDITRFILALFDKEGNPVNLVNQSNQLAQESGSFELMLDVSEEYQCLFWADYGSVNGPDNYYNTSNLEEVTINKDKTPHEAFSGIVETKPGMAFYSITLKHAVARMDYIATDIIQDESTITASYSNYYRSLNARTGEPTEGEEQEVRTFHPINTTGLLCSDYIFAGKAQSRLMDIDLAINNQTLASISNVPYQVNHKTNIKGKYYIQKGESHQFNVSMDDNWNYNPSEADDMQIRIVNGGEPLEVNSLTQATCRFAVELNQTAEIDIPVVFEWDPKAVDSYNEKNNTSYSSISPDKIAITNGLIAIGQNSVEISCHIDLTNEEMESSFLIPLKLKDFESEFITVDGEQYLYLIASKSLTGTYNVQVISKGRDGRNYGNIIWHANTCARGDAWAAPMERARYGITADTSWDGYALLFSVSDEPVEGYPSRRKIEIHTFLELLDIDGGTNKVSENNSYFDFETGEIYLDFKGYESWFNETYQETISFKPIS